MLMKRLRWQILVVLVTLVLVGVLLLSQKPIATVIDEQPTTGGRYTEGLVGAMGRLNPLLDWNNSPDRDVDRLLYSGVMRFDSRGMPEPDLAESWGTTEDARFTTSTCVRTLSGMTDRPSPRMM